MSSLEKIDLTWMEDGRLEINLIPKTFFPCATLEYQSIQNSNKIEHESIYGEDFFQLIFREKNLFRYYLTDQMRFYLNEAKIQLPIEFVCDFLTINQIRSNEEHFNFFLYQSKEFTEILRLIEITLKFLRIEEIQNIIKNQLIVQTDITKSSPYYRLVPIDDQWYQLSPGTTDKVILESSGDPIIEISLMNLIELLLSPTIIDRVNSIEELTTVFSLIIQGMRNLSSYMINNFEKLRSSLSIIRYINSQNSDRALNIFKDLSRKNFATHLDSCFNIHRFISEISQSLKSNHEIFNERTLKFEVELLIDWLADHGDDYPEILMLINEENNHLWTYSAKIFLYIDRKLNLFSNLQTNHGQLIFDETHERLNEFLRTKSTNQKIQRLIVNRFHMNLMIDVQQKTLEEKLINDYPYFEANLRELRHEKSVQTVRIISVISWLKYYTQSYALALAIDMRIDVLQRIDQLLSTSNNAFSSTVKLFIFKQLIQITRLQLNQFRERYLNRNLVWIRPFIQKPFSQEILLPTPLFQCQEDFYRVNRSLNRPTRRIELQQLIIDCRKSQKLSYSFLCWFIQYYYRFLLPNTDIDGSFMELLQGDFESELIQSFTPFGYRFLISLCSNFSKNSYFHLHQNMTSSELQKRLVTLNLVAVFISFKSSKERISLENLFLNDRRQFPSNYFEHLSTIVVPGLNINQTVRLGYHYEKEDDINRSISFHFIHMLTHGLLLVLHDLKFLTDDQLEKQMHLTSPMHFREHLENDFKFLLQLTGDEQQGYIWFYKLFNHLVIDQIFENGLLNNNERVIRLGKNIEEKLIFPHIHSIASEIADYKQAYGESLEQRHVRTSIEHFIDEMKEDENQYPLLNFFNVTTFHTSNLLHQFIGKMQILPYGEETYPVTNFLLKKLDKYLNIRHFYPLVAFSNDLIDKFNYRIKREDAKRKTISHYLTVSSTQQLFDEFLNAWYDLKLKEVQFGSQRLPFERTIAKEDFAHKITISTVLLNSSKDQSSLLFAACLRSLAEFQNELVDYFHHVINKSIAKKVPLQAIRPEYIFSLDEDQIRRKFNEDCLLVNYSYDKGRDIRWDYEEIEMYFRNMIGSLVFIDTETLHYLNYQFEWYAENHSVINDIRDRVQQMIISDDERMNLRNLIVHMNNDDILNLLGSFDHVFAYLRNSNSEHTSTITPIQTFIQHHIQSHACLNDYILRRPPFSTIQLQYLIDLYEILEEIAFDRILRPYVKQELLEEAFDMQERENVLNRFSQLTFQKETIARTLKAEEVWISVLKRLMMRVLNANVTLDVPLQSYLKRTDFWSESITEDDLTTFTVEENILLKHTFIILTGLEKKNQTPSKEEQPHIQSQEKQQQHIQTWMEASSGSSRNSRAAPQNRGKIRV